MQRKRRCLGRPRRPYPGTGHYKVSGIAVAEGDNLSLMAANSIAISGNATEGVSKLHPRPISSPEGTNSIAGGSAPGQRTRLDQPCKGCTSPVRFNPYRVGPDFRSLPGALPPAIEFVPSRDHSISKIDF